MSNTIVYRFNFDLKDRVEIPAIKETAIIDGLMVTEDGRKYGVVYWHNGERRQQWLYASELEAIGEEAKR